MGDGVLAYFGFPRAHEDDAEWAVRAGLDLSDAVAKVQVRDGEVLKTRIGVATGIVVVGDLRNPPASARKCYREGDASDRQ
jgi:class 3 adenylate cyclase